MKQEYYKYPRTMHLPWSPNLQNDDRLIENLDGFENKRVVISTKMDGENSNIYPDLIHARSIDSKQHESRTWLHAFAKTFQYNIPKGWRVCGENMYAKHSIFYNNLQSYFYGFSIWNEKNFCLSWDETKEWFSLLGVTPVRVLYDGIFDLNKIPWDSFVNNHDEGYVMRIADSFHFDDFYKYVAKYVRKNHVQTSDHWMTLSVIKNGLIEELKE